MDGDCGTAEVQRPCGDARAHEWAVYVSTEGDFNKLPRWDCSVPGCGTNISGTVKLNDNPANGTVTKLLKTGSDAKLSVGDTEEALVGSLTLPADIPRTNPDGTGTYYLHFYDDRQRIVNELDETNNHWTEGPIVVEAPGYGFLGLQTPCTGTTCDKTGTMPLAWQFTNGSTPVDSVSTLPRLRFYGGCPTTGLPTASRGLGGELRAERSGPHERRQRLAVLRQRRDGPAAVHAGSSTSTRPACPAEPATRCTSRSRTPGR